MQLCKEFLIGDIWDYEINDIDILAELGQFNLFVITDLIRIGNKCGEAEAESLFNKYIENMTLEQIVEELAYEVIGARPSDNEDEQADKKEQTFSDVLWEFFNQIQTLDSKLTLSEFRSMSTKNMYKYAEGLKTRYIAEINKMLSEQYSNAGMIVQALGGDLKECPRLDEDGTIHKKTLLEKIIRTKRIGGIRS
jgi:ribosomal protein L29